ncbi:glutaminyl-peptide cyclotransferase [Flavobacterium sp.]|uniref:glutaminyl-peptide cyclotransferase n=1 Tax=Flavobacterium sp. TaxID=239 RepID=UPI0031D8EECA
MAKKKLVLIIFFFFCIGFESCKKKENSIIDNKSIETDFVTINTYAHDINSFTEGLFIDDGVVYESTGSPNELPNTKSVFGILDLNTGMINVKVQLDKTLFFGEGIAKINNKIYQLTYKNKIGFIYDSKTFKQLALFQFDNNEGWGLTNMKNDFLIMSDGTNILTFLNSTTLKPVKKLEIFENNKELFNLNELEYIDGYIYANVYGSNKIVKIDAENGDVVKTIDLSSLYSDSKNKFQGSLEMNGIAYNKEKKTFLITGKMWPCVYEIKLK